MNERSPLALRHALVLMAATACGFAINRLTVPEFRTWSDTGKQVMTGINDALLLLLPHVLSLTLAVPILHQLNGALATTQWHPQVETRQTLR